MTEQKPDGSWGAPGKGPASIEETAQRALPSLASALGWGFKVSVQDATSRIGDGALSRFEIPTKILVVDHDFMGAHRIAMRFRGG